MPPAAALHEAHCARPQLPAAEQSPDVSGFDVARRYGAEARLRIQHCPATPTRSHVNAEHFGSVPHMVQHSAEEAVVFSPRFSGPTMSKPCWHVLFASTTAGGGAGANAIGPYSHRPCTPSVRTYVESV